MSLRIFKTVSTRVPRARLKTIYELVTGKKGASTPDCEVNLVFLSSPRMKKLNYQYLSKNRATDVLSFVIDQDSRRRLRHGEIYICTPVAVRQAKQYQTTLALEYMRLFCHGVLHLLGYDHQHPDEEAKMVKREQLILSQAGIG